MWYHMHTWPAVGLHSLACHGTVAVPPPLTASPTVCPTHRKVNEEMKLAATYAIAGLAKRPPTNRREQQPPQQAGEALSSNSLSMPDLAASGQQGQQGDGLARTSVPASSPRPGAGVKKSASDHELMKHLHKRHISGGASSHDMAAQAAAAAQYRCAHVMSAHITGC
jgi:hypothetical protein